MPTAGGAAERPSRGLRGRKICLAMKVFVGFDDDGIFFHYCGIFMQYLVVSSAGGAETTPCPSAEMKLYDKTQRIDFQNN
jgi:hypothetical protein